MENLTLNGEGYPRRRATQPPVERVNDTAMRLIPIAQRSDVDHDVPLTWNGGERMPCLHINARSRQTTTEEVLEVYAEEVSRL